MERIKSAKRSAMPISSPTACLPFLDISDPKLGIQVLEQRISVEV